MKAGIIPLIHSIFKIYHHLINSGFHSLIHVTEEDQATAEEGKDEVLDGMDEEEMEGDDGDNEKKYEKKIFVSRPYDSEFVKQTEEEVHALNTKNQR